MQTSGRSAAGSASAAAGRRTRAAVPRVSRSRRRRRTLLQRLLPIATTLGLLALWELLARAGVLPAEVSPCTDVLAWIVEQLDDTAFWTAIRQTVWHWFAGLVLGATVGVVLGAAIGSVPIVQRLLTVPLEFLRPIPTIVFLPLLILVMGSRSQTAIILTALAALWPVLFQTIYGVHAIEPHSVETARVFGLRRGQILWNVSLPSILPYLATGVRISSSIALVVAVSVELVGGIPGLGAALANAAQNGVYAAMYGLLLVSGLLGLALNVAFERAERRLLGWHVSHRDGAA